MKAAYLGGTRGHQSSYYRPGSGWTTVGRRRSYGRGRSAVSAGGIHVSPLAVARPRRPGWAARTMIVAAALIAALAVAAALGGLQLF